MRVSMDLAKKFLMIERELTTPKEKNLNSHFTEIEEIINWRMMFAYTPKWLEKTMSSMFEEQYKNKRKKIYIVNLDQDSIQKILKEKNILQNIIDSSAGLVNGASSKIFIFVHQALGNVSLDMYHLQPISRKESAIQRLENGITEVQKSLLSKKINSQCLKSIVQVGDEKDYYLRGVRVKLVQAKTKTTTKSRDYGQFANI